MTLLGWFLVGFAVGLALSSGDVAVFATVVPASGSAVGGAA